MGVAGAKRKGASFPSLAACAGRPCKRPSEAAAAMEEWRDWASLPTELTGLISTLVLAADVVDYMAFRAVCAPWRASAPHPRDPTLRDARLRPRGWVALCDGDGVRPADACEVAFLHTATGRCVRARLPELCGYRIVGFTDGLLILINKATTAVRVLHPFTRVAVDLPPMSSIFLQIVKDQESRAWMRAAVCLSQTSSDSIAVVAWFPTSPVVVVAEPSFPCWHIVNQGLQLAAGLPFGGRLYGVISTRREVVQVYPEHQNPVVAHIPDDYSLPQSQLFFLVESNERLMVIVRHFDVSVHTQGWAPWEFALFEVDTTEHQGLTPVSSLGDRALFLSSDRCLSVSQNNLPSISRDAIYFHYPHPDPVVIYFVASRTCVRTSTFSITHDYSKVIRPSVRPFTLADHLLTFCSHRHWSGGLMFHEYHCLLRSWKELARKLKAQDREIQVPSLRGSSSRSRPATKAIVAQRGTTPSAHPPQISEC